jgi:hypothetical protein
MNAYQAAVEQSPKVYFRTGSLGYDYIEGLPNKVSLTVPANGSRMGEGAGGTIVLALAARK